MSGSRQQRKRAPGRFVQKHKHPRIRYRRFFLFATPGTSCVTLSRSRPRRICFVRTGSDGRYTKLVSLISRKAPGKILPVIRIVSDSHPELIAVIDLRDAAVRERERHVHHRSFGRRPRQRYEAIDIVIACEQCDVVDIAVKAVVFQHIPQRSGRLLSGKNVCRRLPQIEIKNARAQRVDTVSRPPIGRFDLLDRRRLSENARRQAADEHNEAEASINRRHKI